MVEDEGWRYWMFPSVSPGTVSHACWIHSVVSVTVTTAPLFTTPPVFLSIKHTPTWLPGEGPVLRGFSWHRPVNPNWSCDWLDDCFLCVQLLQPDGGCCRRSVLGLQLLSYVLLLAGAAGPPPLSGLLCSRYRHQRRVTAFLASFPCICLPFRDGHHAVDRELGDLPAVGPQHRQCLFIRGQLDLQRPGVSHLSACGWASHLSR